MTDVDFYNELRDISLYLHGYAAAKDDAPLISLRSQLKTLIETFGEERGFFIEKNETKTNTTPPR